MIKSGLKEIFGEYNEVALGVITVALAATTILAIYSLLELAVGSNNGLSSAADVITATFTIFISVANVGLLFFAIDARRSFLTEKVNEEIKELIKEIYFYEHIIKNVYQKFVVRMYLQHWHAKNKYQYEMRIYDYISSLKNTNIKFKPIDDSKNDKDNIDKEYKDSKKSYGKIVKNIRLLNLFLSQERRELDKALADLLRIFELIEHDFFYMWSILSSLEGKVGVIRVSNKCGIEKLKLPEIDLELETVSYKYKRYSTKDFNLDYQSDDEKTYSLGATTPVLDIAYDISDSIREEEVNVLSRVTSCVAEYQENNSCMDPFANLKLSNGKTIHECFEEIQSTLLKTTNY